MFGGKPLSIRTWIDVHASRVSFVTNKSIINVSLAYVKDVFAV